MSQTLQDVNLKDLLSAIISKCSTENPIDYFDKIYASINPIMMMEALNEAKSIIANEGAQTGKSKKAENAEVYITLGGESMTQSFYTGIIAALLWLPNYIRESSHSFKVDQSSIDITLKTLNKCALPQIHDVKEEVIKGEKVMINPSNIKHYSAFLASIVSWLNNGVNSFKIEGTMKTNLELCRYLSAAAVNSFPSVPFAAYHVGQCKTNDIMKLSENLGKSFDWLKYMSSECYAINEPKFVVTTDNAPIVSILGHPLTETFIAKIEDGNAKWLGLFVETEEFAKLCTQAGLSVDQLKKYIIITSPEEHVKKLEANDPIAVFINKQKLTKQIFELRHKFSTVKLDECESYDV